MTPLVGVLVLLGMILLVPLGLPLLGTRGLARLRPVWPLGAAPAGCSLLISPGAGAAALTLPYLLLGGAAAGLAIRRLLGARRAVRCQTDALRELTALVAGTSLLVAAGSLTAERAGFALLGFDSEVLALTVAHFHYAGFAVTILAGLVLVHAPGRAAVVGAAAVPAGTVLVAGGHFAGRAVELAGALALSAGLLCLSAATLRSRLPRTGVARWLVMVSAAVAPFTMALAVWWAVGRLTGLPHLDLASTAATHGVGNALGVCLCGLLGWRLLRPTAV